MNMVKFYKKRGKAIWKRKFISQRKNGKYGFVMLKYYTPPHGFEEDATFTDSKALFEALWQEWLDMKLYLIAKGTPLLEKGYKGVFESLTKEKQSELIGRKAVFARMAGIGL